MINTTSAGLVAAREVREQVRGRALWISTAISVIAVALVIVLPKVLSSGPSTYRVGVSDSASTTVATAVTAAVKSTGAKVQLVKIASRADASADLRAKGDQH
ncbi:MAG TPA: hypothetical protein VN738_06625, partial [Acidothermaceae bacterium]|nr:hypothetical protein [Acidothermaceae bacterium]